jgi:predicted dehydrogenase
VASGSDARIARAMSEAQRLLDLARNRVRRTEGVALIREAFSCLAEAKQRIQAGAIDNVVWQHVGHAVMLADQVGRSPIL